MKAALEDMCIARCFWCRHEIGFTYVFVLKYQLHPVGPAGRRAAMQVPEPVVLCSVEAPSMRLQGAMESALACLSREDPALKVTHCSDTAQMVSLTLYPIVSEGDSLFAHNIEFTYTGCFSKDLKKFLPIR